jgi:tRNA uridine 5-carboxymethylaminomethyl modification enzyme
LVRSSWDIVVVGAGHAGCEAAAAAARLGCRVAIVTLRLDHLGRLSCNPAVGGLAKGQLVRELDALGGLMARVTDATTLQFRRLNTRKGLAVRSSRAQVDVVRYPAEMQRVLQAIDGLDLVQGEVSRILHTDGRVQGVRLADGQTLSARAVVLTTGTFLGGLMHQGSVRTRGGRIGDTAAHALSRDLAELGLRLGRLKTGTTPRLAAGTIRWDALQEQPGVPGRFSFRPTERRLPRISCYLGYTNARTHDVIRADLDQAPVFTGQITGTGPRYCPSIEDKVVRFAHRQRHLLFLEPESLDNDRIYVSGLATSLPRETQQRVIHSIVGLEQAEIRQFGYAVEYDFSDPRDLDRGLQHQALQGLYLAGQVNGTSGYEEAAVQGFVAGVSAARQEPFELRRDQAYIGVLIDDLVTRGVGGEPYRMFTSRAEHRLLLREDNADLRLMPIGRALGLVEDQDWRAFERRRDQNTAGREALQAAVHPSAAVRATLAAHGLGGLKKPATYEALLRRPGVSYADLIAAFGLPPVVPEVATWLETDAKYDGYLRKARLRATQNRRLAGQSLSGIDFAAIPGLSIEIRQRLAAAQPRDLGAASRLPCVTPAAVSVLAVWLVRQRGPGLRA